MTDLEAEAVLCLVLSTEQHGLDVIPKEGRGWQPLQRGLKPLGDKQQGLCGMGHHGGVLELTTGH